MIDIKTMKAQIQKYEKLLEDARSEKDEQFKRLKFAGLFNAVATDYENSLHYLRSQARQQMNEYADNIITRNDTF